MLSKTFSNKQVLIPIFLNFLGYRDTQSLVIIVKYLILSKADMNFDHTLYHSCVRHKYI